MDIFKDIELQDCPACRGTGLLEEDKGWSFYVACLDCGAQTGDITNKSPEEREAAAKQAAELWNMGKVVSPDPGC